MLAYRSALLDEVASNGFCTGMGEAVAHVLKVRLHNIRRAVERKARMAESRESEFSLQKRKKQTNVLDSAVVALVELWWYKETRVSPNMKDTVKKYKYWKNSPSHALHLLLQTQVCGHLHTRGYSKRKSQSLFSRGTRGILEITNNV
jgi:hypothetical protein